MMKLVSFAVALLATLVSARVGNSNGRFKKAVEPVAGSYVVVLNDQVTNIRAAQKAILKAMPGTTSKHVFEHALKGFHLQASSPLTTQDISSLLAMTGVDSVEEVSSRVLNLLKPRFNNTHKESHFLT
jgi:rRNA processing protein Krr1/Pno1